MLAYRGSGQQLENLRDQKPLSIHGHAGINLISYGSQGIPGNMDPFSFLISTQATASIYGVSIPFSLRYSGKDPSYTQPFNQFGMSPQYKWITAHAGYRNLTWSPFTLAGHTFLGGGVEMQPGKFRFGFVYGRFRDNTEPHVYGPDTLRTFKRKGFSTRIGYGTQHNYIDFIFLKIQDDSTSLEKTNPETRTPSAQNGVAGLNTRLRISPKLSLEAEAATSLYTTDLASPGLSPQEGIPPWLTGSNPMLRINLSSELLTAIRTSLHYRTKTASARLEYRRIDPGYRSMGAYYFTNDIEQLSLAPSFSLLKRKLLLRGSIGIQRDNLRNTKKATSVRAISSVGVSYNPHPVFGIDLHYSNYSNNQRPGRLPLIDSIKQYHTTANFSISPRLFFQKTRHHHMVMLVIQRMELMDHNANTAYLTENQATTINLTYQVFMVKTGISGMAGIQYNQLKNYLMDYKATGFSAGMGKAFLEGKINTGLNQSVVQTKGQQGTAWIMNTTLYGYYMIDRHHSLRLNFYLIVNRSREALINPSFSERKGDFGYVYNF